MFWRKNKVDDLGNAYESDDDVRPVHVLYDTGEADAINVVESIDDAEAVRQHERNIGRRIVSFFSFGRR